MISYFSSRAAVRGHAAYRARQERRATTPKPWLHRVRTATWWTKRTVRVLLVLVLFTFLFAQIGTALHFPWLGLLGLALAVRSWLAWPRHHAKPRLVSPVEAGTTPAQPEMHTESETVPAYVTRLPDGTIQICPWQGEAPR